MSETYTIEWQGRKIEDVVAQVRAIKTWPANVKIYDRAFLIINAPEAWTFLHGIEIGFFLGEEAAEEKNK